MFSHFVPFNSESSIFVCRIANTIGLYTEGVREWERGGEFKEIEKVLVSNGIKSKRMSARVAAKVQDY